MSQPRPVQNLNTYLTSRSTLRRQLFRNVLKRMWVPPEGRAQVCEMIETDWDRCSVDPTVLPLTNIKVAFQVAVRAVQKRYWARMLDRELNARLRLMARAA